MTARILDGKLIAQQQRANVADRTRQFVAQTGVTPCLAAILVGANPASEVYVRNKRKAGEEVGIRSALHRLDADCSNQQLFDLLDQLNADPNTHGILLQLPLPEGLDEKGALFRVDPLKDVDAFHPVTMGLLAQGQPRFLPCTPAGCQTILVESGIAIAGQRITIVGRSTIVGMPLALMLMSKGPAGDATVTVCHSRSRDLAEATRSADIVIAAVGRPEMITADMIRPGAVVIDVGINRLPTGQLVGDVHFASVREVAGAITPVPGGVGPMTIAMLLANTLKAAELQADRRNGLVE